MAAVPRVDSSVIERLFDRSSAAHWDVPRERFEAAILASLGHAFGNINPTSSEVSEYLDDLHLDDLALAIACESGSDRAWEHFIGEYRPLLHRAADAIDPTGGAREVADAIYGELYGLNERDGTRRSLLRYFHGRSKPAGVRRRCRTIPSDCRIAPRATRRERLMWRVDGFEVSCSRRSLTRSRHCPRATGCVYPVITRRA